MPTWLLLLISLGVSSAAAQDVPPPPQPAGAVLREIHLAGATIFNRDDIVWLLKLRQGATLPQPPAEVARALQEAYARDGYSQATVTGLFDQGRLSLTVDEGRIDDIEILGVSPASAERIRRRLGIKPGDIYNARVIGRATGRLTTEALGALEIGPPPPQPAGRPPGRIRAGRSRSRTAGRTERSRRAAALADRAHESDDRQRARGSLFTRRRIVAGGGLFDDDLRPRALQSHLRQRLRLV